MLPINANFILDANNNNPPDFDSIDTENVILVDLPQSTQKDAGIITNPSEVLHSDVLPSFQMHNFMFNRTLNDISFSNELPPEYEESLTGTLASSSNQLNEENSVTFGIEDIDKNNLLLNNLDKLQKINLPFDAHITLTQDMPQIDSPCISVSPLKTYLPGDMVYGYIIFENKSEFRIPFEMFLVSMECEIGVRDPKRKNIVQKKLITMYDLEASFNVLGMDGDNDTCHVWDSSDKTYVGFERRSLDPGVPIKKFFRFKIPNYILDDCCADQITEHLKTPPSFGLNKSIWKNTASTIEIEKALGYGRMSKAGSPIHVNDFALNGEYCSFYINAQIIGKRLDEYKPFYTRHTTHQYDFIFIKNVEHYFRVGKPPPSTNDYVYTNGSTKIQLEYFEKMANEAIEVLAEREMLKNIDITETRDQDEIIFSSNGKSKASSVCEDEKCLSKLNISNNYSNKVSFEFKKDLFSKLDGTLNATFELDKHSTVKGFLPKLLEPNTINILNDDAYMKSVSPTLKLKLIYKPNKEMKDSLKLPTTININPNIISVTLQSAYSIPFAIDNDFLLNDYQTIKETLSRFPVYFNKIVQMMKKTASSIPRATYDLLKGLGYCMYDEFLISDVFKQQTIDLQNKWEFNSTLNAYECSTEIKLEFDVKSILAAPKALLPSFQTCLFARMYKLKLNVSVKKSKSCSTTFPITVV
jgi:hypothetical protein